MDKLKRIRSSLCVICQAQSKPYAKTCSKKCLSELLSKGLSNKFYGKFIKHDSGCWLWTATTNVAGYGTLMHNKKVIGAHRVSWLLHRGEIPKGLEMDHLCRTRNCVNPDHLEPVTGRENKLRGFGASGKNARKEACPRGHSYDYLYINKKTGQRNRICVACKKIDSKKWRTDRKNGISSNRPRKSSLSEEQILEIYKLRDKGLGYRRISAALKIPISTVYYSLRPPGSLETY